ncbi:hypothetical protein Tco_0163509 [Tanacetum coccineum]
MRLQIKNRVFNIGDRVLLFNSRLKIFQESLKPVGPDRSPLLKFSLMETIELSQTDGPNFKVYGLSKNDKTKQNGQNQAREWKKREKSKSKAYTSLMDQPCMSTRSTSSNLFSPLRDPESLIRRRNLGPPPLNNSGPPPVVRPNGPAPRSMEELCQPSINGRGRPIAPIPIEATDFGLRHHMIQQVQNTCQFHGLPGDDANRHIDKFLEITQHMKQNGVSDDALRLSLFPYSLSIL